MKWPIVIIATYAAFVLQTAVARDLAVCGFAPRLDLAALIVVTAQVGGVPALLLAAAWGFLADCFTAGPLGTNVACFAVLACALQRAVARWRIASARRLAAATVPLVWCCVVAGELPRAATGAGPVDLGALALAAAGTALYTAVVVAAAAFALRVASPGENEPRRATRVLNNWRMLTE